MAGGEGSRLNLGEKPLVLVNGRPMISYIIEAFRSTGCEPIVAVSPRTPMTRNWCSAIGVAVCKSEGFGYIEDMIQVVEDLGEEEPLFVCVSDIPGISPANICTIRDAYHSEGKDALSVWVPASLVKSSMGEIPYQKNIRGIDACPVGVNILRGDQIADVQEEFAFLMDDAGLALNVNTRADLVSADQYLKEQSCKKI